MECVSGVLKDPQNPIDYIGMIRYNQERKKRKKLVF